MFWGGRNVVQFFYMKSSGARARGKYAEALLVVLVAASFSISVRFGTEGVPSDMANLSALFEKKEPAPLVLNDEQLADLTKPAIVRIVHHAQATATIPAFDMDLASLTLTFLPQKPATTTATEQYITGSGFVVRSDGYILTNAHVVSPVTIETALTAAEYLKVYFKKIGSMKQKDLEKLEIAWKAKGFNELNAQDIAEQAGKRMLKELFAKSTFVTNSELTVLNPSMPGKLADLVPSGLRATVVSADDDYLYNQKDAAVIHIDTSNLPALSLGDVADLATGQKIYVFGFPSSAQFGTGDNVEPTFTRGLITAIKDSESKDFKILQTDAKISEGSSGSPLFEDDGTVAGIVTFESGMSSLLGDNFAFAIPIEIAEKMLAEKNIENNPGAFAVSFKRGLVALRDRHCKNAIEEFTAARAVHEAFSVAKYVDPYVEKCNAIIAAGQSIDTAWDEWKGRLKEVGYVTWGFLGGGIVLVAGLVLVLTIIRKRMKKDEAKIVELEHFEETAMHGSASMSKETNAAPSVQSPATSPALPAQTPSTLSSQKKESSDVWVAPELRSYVQSARAAKMDNASIKGELRKVGWPDAAIDAALKS